MVPIKQRVIFIRESCATSSSFRAPANVNNSWILSVTNMYSYIYSIYCSMIRACKLWATQLKLENQSQCQCLSQQLIFFQNKDLDFSWIEKEIWAALGEKMVIEGKNEQANLLRTPGFDLCLNKCYHDLWFQPWKLRKQNYNSNAGPEISIQRRILTTQGCPRLCQVTKGQVDIIRSN